MPVQTRRQSRRLDPSLIEEEKKSNQDLSLNGKSDSTLLSPRKNTNKNEIKHDTSSHHHQHKEKSVILLLFCVAGIYVCFLTWGLMQERVSTTPYGSDAKKFTFFIFLNTVQALIASIVAIAYIGIKGGRSNLDSSSRALTLEYIKISIFSCLASPFGYASLKYIDYPTLILGKSCKLVPVVVMNFLIYKRTFPIKTYLIVLLITAGVSLFMFLDPKKKKESGVETSSLYGLFLLSINLALDGAYNSSQDQVFHKYKVRGTSMMAMMNWYSFLLMTLFLVINPYSSELTDALLFCKTNPAVIGDILLFALTGALGQCFIFLTLESFGSLVLVTVTVTRKMFSILLSVFWFGHDLAIGQWLSVALVFVAIGWEAFGKKAKKE